MKAKINLTIATIFLTITSCMNCAHMPQQTPKNILYLMWHGRKMPRKIFSTEPNLSIPGLSATRTAFKKALKKAKAAQRIFNELEKKVRKNSPATYHDDPNLTAARNALNAAAYRASSIYWKLKTIDPY